MSADQRVFWRSGGCTIRVGYDDQGALRFDGYDRDHLDGYEYTVTVARGERTWLDDHGIDRRFRSY